MTDRKRRRGHNEGSIYQRASDGKWVGAVHLGWDDTGRKRKVVYGKTRAEVSQKIARIINDHQKGLPIQTSDKTLSTFLDEWLEQIVKPSLSASTHRAYRSVIKTHIKPSIGKHQLGKLTQHHIQTMLNGINTSPATVRFIRAVLRAALHQAMAWDLVGRNVVVLTKPPKGERFEGYALSPDEIRRVMATVAGTDVEALYAIATSVGMRQAELLGLRWRDVDREIGTINIRHQFAINEPRRMFVELKTKSSRRTISLAPPVLAILRRHHTNQLKRRLQAGGAWENHDLVFSGTNGRPYQPTTLRKDWKIVKSTAGIPDHVRFHDLRHSALTILATRGVPPRTLMGIAGHSTIAVTMQIYAHLDADSVRTSLDLMSDIYEVEKVSS